MAHDTSFKIGSKVAFTAHFLGRKLEYTYEFTDHVPNQRLVMRTAEGPSPTPARPAGRAFSTSFFGTMSMETTFTWEPAGDNATRMTLRSRGESTGFAKITAPLMASAMRRATTKDLARLKGVLESR